MVIPILNLFRDRMSGVWRWDLTKQNITSPSRAPYQSGLYHYNVGNSGKRRRVHLRIANDMSAVMFVDVTDVIHLNPSAAEITWLALENIPIEAARRRLCRRYYSADHRQLSRDVRRLYEMVDSLGNQDVFCPNCSITGVDQAPLFSIPAEAPYKADLALTYGCNNRCSHCYNDPIRYPMPSMPQVMWIDVIDKLHEIGVPHLIFTGGEATLHPDLPQLIHYAETLGFITGLNTNGRRLSHAPYMDQIAMAGLNHVQITLASHRAQSHDQVMGANAFAQTVRGIGNAIDSGIHVITNTTLTRRNCHDVTDILDFLQDLGIRTFAMNGMIHTGGGRSNPDAILPEKLVPILARVRDESRARDMRFLWYTPTEYCRLSPLELEIGAKRCNAGEYSVCIEPNGDVLPCQSFYVSAGNIVTDSWEKIWRSDLFLSFRQRDLHPEAAGLPEMCRECPEMSVCGGGCRLEHQARIAVTASQQPAGSSITLQSIQDANPVSFSSKPCFIPPAGAASTRVRGSGASAKRLAAHEINFQGIYRC